MKRLLSFMAIMTLFVTSALGQRTVSGVVLSGDDGLPIIGATVMVKGTTHVVATDLDGRFILKEVPSDAKTLTVSYIGMGTQDVAIKDNLVVHLFSSVNDLDEVVVVGYGTTTKGAFTGAASVMDGDVAERKNDANFVKSLEGNVTGIQYNNSTSMPGQYGTIYIRGLGSLSSSSQPLYVIDGMPVNSDYDGMSDDTNNYFDPMAAYNPNDIESITVLKDASATAIYGSRAANGVIIINTKKGKQGKLNVTLDVKQGFSRIANNNMKFANATQSLDLFAKGLVARYPSDYTYDSAYAFLKDQYFEWDGVTDTDWMDVISRDAYYQEYNASVSGASGDTRYYFSLGYLDTDGIIVGSDNSRYSGRINLDTKYQWLSAGISAQYSYNTNNSFSQSVGGAMSSPVTAAISSMTPFDRVYTEDGTEYANISNYNPMALQDPDLGDLNRVNNQTINANPWLQLNLPYGIYVKTNFGVNIMDQRQYDYWSAVYNPQGAQYNGLGQQYNSKSTTLTWTNLIGWNYTFNEKHVFDVMIAQEMQRYNYMFDYYSKYDFPFAQIGMRTLATAGSDNGSQYYEASSRLASYFGNAHYSYDSRYYLSASFRRDGSSVFGSNKHWGNFWSVGAKWRIAQEAFLRDNTVIKNADVRITYGTVGNQSLPSLYAARGYYSAGYNYNQTPGMVPGGIENPDLTWESSHKFDVGFDLNLWNRLNVTFDYYNEDTKDALFEVPLSLTTGQSSTWRNIGKIRNRGIELGLRGVVYTNKDVNVSLFGNLTFNQNKVIKLANGSIVNSSYTIIEEGRPYRQFLMREYAGVDPETGKALYYLNEEGDETTDVYTKAAKRYVGSSDPKIVGAFGLNAEGYGFDLSLTFNYRAGGKVYDSGHRYTGWGMDMRTPLECVALDSWTPDNKNAKYPQYIFGDPNYSSSQHSTRFLMNGSFLRLSNITVGYTLPQKITKKAFMDKVRFYINMDNVHTWTASDFVGYNPETYSSGVIAWQYPAVFSFTGGVQVVF